MGWRVVVWVFVEFKEGNVLFWLFCYVIKYLDFVGLDWDLEVI